MSTLDPQPAVPMHRDLDGVARAEVGEPSGLLTALCAATDRWLAAEVVEPAPTLATLPPPVG